jgi:hypothetical protein
LLHAVPLPGGCGVGFPGVSTRAMPFLGANASELGIYIACISWRQAKQVNELLLAMQIARPWFIVLGTMPRTRFS